MKRVKFDQRTDVTAVMTLSSDPQVMWRALSSNARNRIKKAEAAGLRCELTEDRAMVDEYYHMIVRRYAAQSLSFPFGVESLHTLWDCLKPHGRLLTVRVVKDDQTAVSGLFPFDENAVYYFGGSSKAEYNPYCPNELMHWTVMKEAGARGVREYDLCAPAASSVSSVRQIFRSSVTAIRRGWMVTYRAALNRFLRYLDTFHPEVRQLSQLRRNPHILG